MKCPTSYLCEGCEVIPLCGVKKLLCRPIRHFFLWAGSCQRLGRGLNRHAKCQSVNPSQLHLNILRSISSGLPLPPVQWKQASCQEHPIEEDQSQHNSSGRETIRVFPSCWIPTWMTGSTFGTIPGRELTCLSAAPRPDLLRTSSVTKARLSALPLHLRAGNCIIFMNDVSVTFIACQEVLETHLIKTQQHFPIDLEEQIK